MTMPSGLPSSGLPRGVHVFERGWLSSNNILLVDDEEAVLVDSGYATHSEQTTALVHGALGTRSLDLLLNTHLHSDHCGGNARLQSDYPGLRTLVPQSSADAVARWDTEALTYDATGQTCPRFTQQGVLSPGQVLRLAGRDWQVHAAPGHDPKSIVLFDPDALVLLAADALWQSGFGIVFPELEGHAAFDEVAATLDRIEHLAPGIVVPGHGAVFTDEDGGVARALRVAREKLDSYVRQPEKHAAHAAKVLLKFKMLEHGRCPEAALLQWAQRTPYFEIVRSRFFSDQNPEEWLRPLLASLVRSGALARSDGILFNP